MSGGYMKWNTVLIAIVIAHLIGIYLFYLAFIYQDNTTGKFNEAVNPFHSKMRFKDENQKQIYKDQWFPTQSEQLIFSVIDGFYYPWAVNLEEQRKFASKKDQGIPSAYFSAVPFPHPIQRLIQEPNNTILMDSYADGPTLSAIRIKSILRGNLPLHIEVINNIRGVVMPDDNLVYQSKVNGRGKKVHFFGFLYWDQFVGQHFDKKLLTDQVPLYQSHEDDRKILDAVLKENNETDWGTIFTHYEAIDMAVHSYSGVGPQTHFTLQYHSELLRELIDSTKKEGIVNQTIIYMTDHGQNQAHKAQHGGHSDLEKQAIVFGYDKRGFIQKVDRDIGQIMDRDFLLSPQINQIDMTATYCMLKGIPLPAINLGVIVPDFFINRPDVDNTVILNNYFVNVQQIFSYVTELKEGKRRSIQAYASLEQDVQNITTLYNSLFDKQEELGKIDDLYVKDYVGKCISFARRVKSVFQNEITGPNIENTKYATVYFYIIALGFLILVSRLSNVTYPSSQSQEQEAKLISSPVLRTFVNQRKFKMIILGIVIMAALLGIFVTSQFHYILFYILGLALVGYACFVQLKNTKFIDLIKPSKVRDSKFLSFMDTFLIVACIAFNSVLRITNDFFERTYDLTQVVLLIFYATFFFVTIFSRSVSIYQKLYITLLLIIVPALTYECGYHSNFKNEEFNVFFIKKEYKEHFKSQFVRFYYPLILLCLIYTVLIFKSLKAILGNKHVIKKIVFACLCYSQLFCLIAFNVSQFEEMNPVNGQEVYIDRETNYIFISYMLFFATELFKIIFINRDRVSPPNFSWKYATFLMNFYLQAIFVLHYDSIIKYSALLLMIYLVGHVHLTLSIMEWGSKYVFLFLLSGWFFYISEHMERLTDLHIEVLNAGAMFEGFFYPLLNGTLNTFFGQFSVALIVPLFILAEQYQKNKENILENNIYNTSHSFLDIIFSNRSELNLFKSPYNEQETDQSYREQHKRCKCKFGERAPQEYENMNLRGYLYFMMPLFVSFAVAVMRNYIKPFDYWMNKYYIPSFFFQVMFEVVFLVIFLIQFFLVRFHNVNPKRRIVDYNQMNEDEIEQELELQNDMNDQYPL